MVSIDIVTPLFDSVSKPMIYFYPVVVDREESGRRDDTVTTATEANGLTGAPRGPARPGTPLSPPRPCRRTSQCNVRT